MQIRIFIGVLVYFSLSFLIWVWLTVWVIAVNDRAFVSHKVNVLELCQGVEHRGIFARNKFSNCIRCVDFGTSSKILGNITFVGCLFFFSRGNLSYGCLSMVVTFNVTFKLNFVRDGSRLTFCSAFSYISLSTSPVYLTGFSF